MALFFKKGPSRPLFRLFKQTLQILQQKCVKKCPSSIPCWYSNPLPSAHECPSLTIRPGLPPSHGVRLDKSKNSYKTNGPDDTHSFVAREVIFQPKSQNFDVTEPQGGV